MAEKRMFSMSIMDSDAFLDMPLSSQMLYVHLGIRADDDGFVRNPKKIQRSVGCADDDLKILMAKNFIIPFESGVVVIKHWLINNTLRCDRYTPSVYNEEKALLYVKPNKSYTLTQCDGCVWLPEYRQKRLPDDTHSVTDSATVGLPDGIPVGIPDGTPCGRPVGIPSGTPHVNQVVDTDKNRLDKNSIDKSKSKNSVTSIASSDDEFPWPDSPSEESSSKKKAKKEEDETPVVFQLMLNDKTMYDVHQSMVDEFTELYPAVDVPQEFRNMIGWINNNPNKRKTRVGIRKFINAWLAREQDRGHMKMLPKAVGETGVALNPDRDSSLDDIF